MPKFRLLRGIHNEGGNTYYPGEIIDSKSNLAERHNKPGSVRYQSVADDTPCVTDGKVEQDLDSMTVPQLKELAEEEGINMESGLKKDEIIQVLRSALTGV